MSSQGGWESPRILDELDRADDLYFDRVSQIHMRPWSKGRVALVGDAAFCPSLLAGQGSALAMAAAYVLAGELAAPGQQHDGAFCEYELLLRRYIETKQRGATRFSRAFAPKSALGISVRNLIIQAMTVPGVARLSLGREIVDRLQLPEYPWLTAVVSGVK
jgi:2-polyprenyl-6-methoxyphenol hydroxylase-like FAD-dependent oxidoreductase